MTFDTLAKEILARSKNKDDFTKARWEWYLYETFEASEEKQESFECACGHHPIKELCILRNKENDERLVVGNCCVHIFNPDLKSKRIFKGLKDILRMKIPNPDALNFMLEKGQITSKEFGFLGNIRRKRNLSGKQIAWRDAILKRLATKRNQATKTLLK